MKTFNLVNLMLNMTCTIEAEDRRTAQGYAMDLADSDSSDNDHAYWITRRDYHDVEGFKDVSLSNKTYTMVNNELNVYCTVEAQHTAAAINKAIEISSEDASCDPIYGTSVLWAIPADTQDFHGLKNITPILCIDAAPVQICPKCNAQFDWNEPNSGHQVNDYFDLIFCSYGCSHDYAFDYIKANAPDNATANEIIEGI